MEHKDQNKQNIDPALNEQSLGDENSLSAEQLKQKEALVGQTKRIDDLVNDGVISIQEGVLLLDGFIKNNDIDPATLKVGLDNGTAPEDDQNGGSEDEPGASPEDQPVDGNDNDTDPENQPVSGNEDGNDSPEHQSGKITSVPVEAVPLTPANPADNDPVKMQDTLVKKAAETQKTKEKMSWKKKFLIMGGVALAVYGAYRAGETIWDVASDWWNGDSTNADNITKFGFDKKLPPFTGEGDPTGEGDLTGSAESIYSVYGNELVADYDVNIDPAGDFANKTTSGGFSPSWMHEFRLANPDVDPLSLSLEEQMEHMSEHLTDLWAKSPINLSTDLHMVLDEGAGNLSKDAVNQLATMMESNNELNQAVYDLMMEAKNGENIPDELVNDIKSLMEAQAPGSSAMLDGLNANFHCSMDMENLDEVCSELGISRDQLRSLWIDSDMDLRVQGGTAGSADSSILVFRNNEGEIIGMKDQDCDNDLFFKGRIPSNIVYQNEIERVPYEPGGSNPNIPEIPPTTPDTPVVTPETPITPDTPKGETHTEQGLNVANAPEGDAETIAPSQGAVPTEVPGGASSEIPAPAEQASAPAVIQPIEVNQEPSIEQTNTGTAVEGSTTNIAEVPVVEDPAQVQSGNVDENNL